MTLPAVMYPNEAQLHELAVANKTSRHKYHKLHKRRLHLHAGHTSWDGRYTHYSVAQDLTRGQAFRLGLRLLLASGDR